MMRRLIVWGLWIAAAAAIAAPQRVFGEFAARSDVPADPVIEEPIRPLRPDATDSAVVRPRTCGAPEALMMSAGAWLFLMLNFVSDRRRTTRAA